MGIYRYLNVANPELEISTVHKRSKNTLLKILRLGFGQTTLSPEHGVEDLGVGNRIPERLGIESPALRLRLRMLLLPVAQKLLSRLGNAC